MYLLDTNVISEFRKASAGKADRQVAAWANSVSTESMFLSAVCILEMEMGALLMERRDPRQGAVLRSWLEDRVLPAFTGRVLPVDTSVALRCAALHVPNPRSYRSHTQYLRLRAHRRGAVEPVAGVSRLRRARIKRIQSLPQLVGCVGAGAGSGAGAGAAGVALGKPRM